GNSPNSRLLLVPCAVRGQDRARNRCPFMSGQIMHDSATDGLAFGVTAQLRKVRGELRSNLGMQLNSLLPHFPQTLLFDRGGPVIPFSKFQTGKDNAVAMTLLASWIGFESGN